MKLEELKKLEVDFDLLDYKDELIEAIENEAENGDLETVNWDRVEEVIHELADAKVDIYHSDLFEWLAKDLNNQYFVDEAAQEYGIDSTNFSVSRLIATGQYKCYYDNFMELLNFYREQAE